ncbi:catecholate siderophore receptor Fiu [Acinetobacter terrae]|jgi:catecholate siderophore receptor|uniref:catecholate siderophore receptor Fiu n=1 Tax=Acinetobacter terrae TaxID=2731247 RepID=UPI0007D8143D|nr:catecholate siderophore receptor Fiu [Acinetobacter terrae]NNH14463.1 catecholate siderophore receptor Fiu [Acinetobacter terrae]OAL88257.1 TonB-dependent receptor [Acinetobacter terrae]
MAQIKSRKHNRNAQLVALAASLPLMAHAANTQDVTQLPTITVKSDAENKYKADKLSSPKYTQPLVDTPQTVSVIKKELLKEQGATSLVEALRNTPGITLQLGENGNTSAGDAFQMRGFSTQTSTYVDGIRDLGAVTRDVFNLEQIEVVKGPSGAEAGRGSASGYINLATKLPQTENSQEVSATYNTAEHARLTADMNQVINSGTAFRLNAMGQDGGVEGRDYLENNSWAIAPSIAFGLDTDTRLYLYSQHIRQRNIPDGGIPTVGMKGFYNADSALSSAPKVNRENYYGHVDDHEDVDADMFTAKIESDLAENVKLTNITRLGKTHMQRVLTGINTLSTNSSTNPNDWTVSRSRQGVDQENKILANQTTLNLNLKTGAIEHDVVAGLEFLKEQQYNKTMATQMPGQTPVTPTAASLYNPDRNQVLPSLVYTGGYTNGETDTAAAYLFDTLKFSDRFQLNGGVRVDYYDTEYDALTLPSGSGSLVPANFGAHDTLVSWKVGGLFKPTTFSSVYASYAKSLTPPGSANFTLSETGANSSAAEPQETHHYEIGTKWDLLEGKLALNAAAYRTENENQFTIDSITQLSVQEGKKRVDGVELSAVGQITDVWNVSAGVAHMKVKQLNQQTATATTVAERWSPEWTASLWSTYDVAGFKLGLGARYVDDQKRVITDSTAAANMPSIPGYVVFDAMAGYTLNKNASVNLNVYNLADKEYISTLNNGGGRVVLGQPRSAALTFNYKF